MKEIKQIKMFAVVLMILLFVGCEDAMQKKNIESVDNSGSAAFLFAYTPKKGMVSEFENGYKKHLEWHKIIIREPIEQEKSRLNRLTV